METARLLVESHSVLPRQQQELLYYWGPDETYEYIHGHIPSVTRLMGLRPHLKECLLPYLLTFGLGGLPQECQGLGIALPPEYTGLAWGWPYRFLARVQEADARFYLLLDTERDAEAFAAIPMDGIVTDNIDKLGKIYSEE